MSASAEKAAAALEPVSAPAPVRRAASGVPLRRMRRAQEDPAWVRWSLTAAVLAVVAVLVGVPLVSIFATALSAGVGAYWSNLFGDPDTLHSIWLTLTVVPIALCANLVFGVAAAWSIARFDFPGRSVLIALIDLPFSVSPVVAGLMFVLLFGLQGYFGKFLREDGYAVVPYLLSGLAALLAVGAGALLAPARGKPRRGLWRWPPLTVALGAAAVFGGSLALQLGLELWPRGQSLQIIFAVPGLVLATSFVTFPFVARELIPVLEAVGPDEDLAAVSLGANAWQMFWQVTVPNIRWGLAYGLILCNARAMGEFGAVYVVSGHIAGQTDTMPLRIEKLFQEYNLPGAFAVASVLTLLAILTLVAKAQLEGRGAGARRPGQGAPAPAQRAERRAQ